MAQNIQSYQSSDGELIHRRPTHLSDTNKSVTRPIFISEDENKEILQRISKLKIQPEFSLTIPSMVIKDDHIQVLYLAGRHHDEDPDQEFLESDDEMTSDELSDMKRIENLEEKLRRKYSITQERIAETQVDNPNEEDIERDVALIRDTLRGVVPNARILSTRIHQMPRFLATAGLSSRLCRVDPLNIEHRIGVTTAILTGTKTTKDYALTVGHRTNIGDQIYIRLENGSLAEIGVVVDMVVGNENDTYVDAALIRLKEDAVEELQLTQHFLIDGTPHIFRVSAQSPETRRVILRAVDQTADSIKGVVTTNYLHIIGESMHNCTQISRYREDGNHSGIIHCDGNSGLMGTYEPTIELPGRVQPVLMLIGLHPEYDENGTYISHSSVGIDLERILSRFVPSIGEQFQIKNIL